MFTVIIAQKDFIEKGKEYQLFLQSFMDPKKVAFCEWFPEHERLADMLPTLTEVVGRRRQWRAVIICDEEGITKRNPFDMVPLRMEPLQTHSEDAAEEKEMLLASEHKAKLQAFEEASRMPLSRLVTYFCESPTVTAKNSMLDEDPSYNRYMTEIRRKQELRQQIRGDEVMYVTKPTEIVCIAKRTCVSSINEYELAWESHDELEYSRFFDRNMYFEKMRYLIFDILPKEQRNYPFDYIRFLYATMLLASNEIPAGTLTPNRVYCLDFETNDEVLRDLLFTYEAKLKLTKDTLERRIREIRAKKPAKLTDREAERIFCAKVNVPVVAATDLNRDELYVSSKGIGLSNGCPGEEHTVWEAGYKKSKKELHRMLKQSRRAVSRAAKDARIDNQELDKVGLLNEFQKDDIKEHINEEELAMLGMNLPELYQEENYLRKMDAEDQKVRSKCEKRMSRRSTIVLGVLALFAYVLSFFTIFFGDGDAFNLSTSVIITLSALGLFAVIALMTLFFLRSGLTKLFRGYNRLMHETNGAIDSATAEYSRYLGHMCNVRRGFAVLNANSSQKDPASEKITLYKKHILDIDIARAELREIFGHYMSDDAEAKIGEVREYEHNFDRPVKYDYPLPYSEGTVRTIEFLQRGSTVETPVDFVKSILVRREELYD